MAVNKHFQFLRKGGFPSLDAAKTSLTDKLKTTLPGEPVIAYYNAAAEGETADMRVLLGIGDGDSGSSMFYNAATVDEAIIKAKSDILGDASESANTLAKIEALLNNEVADRKAAINALDVDAIAKEGEYIVSVCENDGKISATTKQVAAAEVSYDKTGDKVITAASTVSAAIKELDEAAKSAADGTLSYKIVSAQTSDTNVREAWKIQSKAATATTWSDVSESSTIKVYKDSALIKVYLGSSADTIDETSGEITEETVANPQSLNFKYELATGKYSLTKIDVSKFLVEAEFASGVTADASGVVHGVVDTTSEAFLTVGEGGFKLSGVQDAINAAQASATTVIAEGTDAGNNMSIVETTGADGHKIFTINLSDVASASGLTAETSARQSQDNVIEASVGLAADGSHVPTTGNYTSGASTIAGEISALDTKLKSTSDVVDKLDGAVTVEGSVKKQIKDAIDALDITDTAVTDQFVTSVSETDGKISVTRGGVHASGVTAVAIESGDTTVAVTGGTVAAQISSLAKSVKEAASQCALSSGNKAIDVATASTGTTVTFKLSASGATPDMLSIVDDGVKLSDTWDCGEWA